MTKTIAVHVRFDLLYISLPSSAKQHREMTKFCVVYETWTTTVNILHFHFSGTVHCGCNFNLNKFLEPLAY